MNEPPLERNESIIDIFVLSISESIAPQLTEHLEEKGYRVTLFSDSTRLLEILREGKPNLLICDTTTVEDGFEVCRRIKADSDLWVIPVLIFTSATTLTDLLNVLDCNADNFLAYPSDLPYRLSLIESMLTTPVERQTPDLIKTQFKINHEDRIYVVSASRRKILEFLLSSFEIAVNKSSELSESNMEIQRLTESAETLEESVTEHTCVIDLLNASIKQKEQKIIALTSESAEKGRTLSKKTEEMRKLAEERDADKTLIGAKDDNIRSLTREKEEAESFHRSEIDALRQQVSGLLSQIDTAKARLDSVQREVEEEKTHCISLQGTLQETINQKDLAEKTLHALLPEHEQLKSAFKSEQDRAISAEKDIQGILQAKAQSEQDLNEKISGLDQTLQQKDTDLIQLKTELETEKNKRISGEEQMASLIQEKDRSESSLQSAINDLNRQLNALQEEYRTASTALETKGTLIKSLEGNLAESRAEKEKTEEKMRADQVLHDTTLTELNQALVKATATSSALETDLDAVKTQARTYADELALALQGKDRSESSLQSAINDLNRQLNALQEEYRTASTALETKGTLIKSLEGNLAESRSEKEKTEEKMRADQVLYNTTLTELNQALAKAAATSSALETDLDAAKTQARTYADELALALQDKEGSGEQVRSLTGELDQAREALEKNENLIKSLREDLANVISEKEKTEDRVKTDMESYKTTFIRLKHDLDDTLTSRRTMEKDLAAVKTQNMAYAQELTQATRSKEQSEQQVRLLVDELERLKAELDTERNLHRTSNENLESAGQARQRFERDLRTSADELNALNARLENERNLRLIAEEKIHTAALEQKRLQEELHAVTEELDRQEKDRALKIQNLKTDLGTVCDLQKSLEEEVSILNTEKIKAEQQVQALTLELDQARTALAEEWEDHMTSDERLAAAVLERQRLQESISRADLAGTEKENVQKIVAKEPDLPVKIDPASHSLELVLHPEEQTPPVSGDDPASHEPSAESEMSGMDIRSASFSGIEDLFEEDEPAPQPAHGGEAEAGGNNEELPSETGSPDAGREYPGIENEVYYEIEPEKDAEQDTTGPDISGAIPGPVFSFNRRQWFGLIKWAHHNEALSRDQRLQIIRMGRLIQKNRRLTKEQEDQIREMISLVQALGYRPE